MKNHFVSYLLSMVKTPFASVPNVLKLSLMSKHSELIEKVERVLLHSEASWHKVFVYIFFNIKHEERRRRGPKHVGKSYRVQLARCN